jgi:hypothetical protein
MSDARRDAQSDCNGHWVLGRSIIIEISIVEVPEGGGSRGLPSSYNKRCHASAANLYEYICWLSMNL